MAVSKIEKKPFAYKRLDFGQETASHTFTFSGYATTRTLYGEIVVAGQGGITSPVTFSLGGVGGYAQVSGVGVSPNSDGISASGSSITVPSNIGYGWGAITIILYYDEPSLTITHAKS